MKWWAVEVRLLRQELLNLQEAGRLEAKDLSEDLSKFGQCIIRVVARVVEGATLGTSRTGLRSAAARGAVEPSVSLGSAVAPRGEGHARAGRRHHFDAFAKAIVWIGVLGNAKNHDSQVVSSARPGSQTGCEHTWRSKTPTTTSRSSRSARSTSMRAQTRASATSSRRRTLLGRARTVPSWRRPPGARIGRAPAYDCRRRA